MHSLAGMRWVSYPGGAHSFTAFSRSHWPFWCGTVGSDPTLSLSRVGLAPPLSFSLYLSCACGPCAPLLTWALLPHPCFAQAGAASLSPGRSLARDTPRMPQKPLVSVSVSLEFLSLYICVMGVNHTKKFCDYSKLASLYMYKWVVREYVPKTATARNKATNWNRGEILGRKNYLL